MTGRAPDPALRVVPTGLGQRSATRFAPDASTKHRAVEAGIITGEEHQQVLDADEIRDEVIQVDSFDPETYRGGRAAGDGAGTQRIGVRPPS